MATEYEALAGAQHAIFVTLKFLLAEHKGNPQSIARLSTLLEAHRAYLLSTTVSDGQLQVFDELADSVLSTLL